MDADYQEICLLDEGKFCPIILESWEDEIWHYKYQLKHVSTTASFGITGFPIHVFVLDPTISIGECYFVSHQGKVSINGF